jgi:pimeloyl-ACP methyl ester carboxylesterase
MATPGGEQMAFSIGDRVSALADVPTLVLWGSEDRVICASDARRCASHPLAEIHVARGIGHMLPLEAPAWTNGHITHFVRSLDRRLLPVRTRPALAPAA